MISRLSWLILCLSLLDHSDGQLFDLDPDIFRDSPQLIESRGFQYESHSVTTEDGYILRVFRILNQHLVRDLAKPNPIVLWHGIAVTSDSWLFSTVGEIDRRGIYVENNDHLNDCRTNVTSNLAFTLSSCGYDVWLPNTRGTHYSLGHTSLDSTFDTRYWQYSLTELGIYDIPAVVRYVMTQTNRDSVAYIGHSLGTASMFALLSLQPDFERHIKPFIALAPIAYLGNMESIARLFVPLEPILRFLPAFPLGIPVPIAQFIGVFVCGNGLLVQLCADVFYSINGYDPDNFNRTRVPVDAAHSGASVSTWVYSHLAQLVSSRCFRQMDRGVSDNIRRYGQSSPPNYPLCDIRSRNIALFRGLNDPLADTADVNLLVQQLEVPLLDNYVVSDPKWNHQDFQLGVYQGYFVNTRILDILRLFDN